MFVTYQRHLLLLLLLLHKMVELLLLLSGLEHLKNNYMTIEALFQRQK